MAVEKYTKPVQESQVKNYPKICVTVNNLNVYNHLVMTGDGNV